MENLLLPFLHYLLKKKDSALFDYFYFYKINLEFHFDNFLIHLLLEYFSLKEFRFFLCLLFFWMNFVLNSDLIGIYEYLYLLYYLSELFYYYHYYLIYLFFSLYQYYLILQCYLNYFPYFHLNYFLKYLLAFFLFQIVSSLQGQINLAKINFLSSLNFLKV